MKRLTVMLAASLCALQVAGQTTGKVVFSEDSFLEQIQERDSVLIGDQLRYGFHLKGVPEGTLLMPPDFSKGFMPGDSVEIVRQWTFDTVKVHGGKKNPTSRDIDVSLVITSFEEGSYELTPLSVLKQSAPGAVDTLVFKSLPLQVFTMPVDTATYVVHDIKGQINYPLTLKEILPYVAAVWLAALLAIIVWALLSSRRRESAEAPAYKDPPYLVALRKLERYRGDKHWARDRQKAFYSGVTDALREYIDARYGIDAPEMTTAELFDSLKETDVPAGLYEEMKDLFETADLVKFAKAYASDEENAKAVPAAVRFVTSTYQTAPAPEPAEGTKGQAVDDSEGGAE